MKIRKILLPQFVLAALITATAGFADRTAAQQHNHEQNAQQPPQSPADAPILRLEDLERHLTILEEKLLAALTMTAPEAALLGIRGEAEREMAPYRSKMPAAQIEQLLKQFTSKRLLEQAGIPRLSLFYM